MAGLENLPGDATLDGHFSSADLVAVFTLGKYETGQPASWTSGDWNRDGFFNSSDLVLALQTGLYEVESVLVDNVRASAVDAVMQLADAHVLSSSPGGVPTVLDGDLSAAGVNAPPSILELLAPAFAIPINELRLESTVQDELGFTHTRYSREINGLPVIGAQFLLHQDAQGNFRTANADPVITAGVDTQPVVTESQAIQLAIAADPELNVVSHGVGRLVYVSDASERAQLSWEIEVNGDRGGDPVQDAVFVDAVGGTIVTRHAKIHSALSRRVFDGNGTTTTRTLVRSEGQAATGNALIDQNYDLLGDAYDCFRTEFGRDSYDAKGGTIDSTVNYDVNLNNAFYSHDGTGLKFGNGDGMDSRNWGSDYDIVVHEFTHWVTDNTSKLIYQDESGALNESFSDIMAAVCSARRNGLSADTWRIGEVAYTPGNPNDALRRMDNPALEKEGNIDFYPNRQRGGYDYGYVHFNSGIANLAFFLTSQGGRHPRNLTNVQVPGLGITAAARIFYRAFTHLTPQASIRQAQVMTVLAAQDLYGANAAAAVSSAWEAVGVLTPSNTNTTVCQSEPQQRVPGTPSSRADLAAAWHDLVWTDIAVFPSQESSFAYHSQWDWRTGGWAPDAKFAAGDFDGNGLQDVVSIWNLNEQNAFSVRRSNGTTFLYPEHWLLNGGGWLNSTQWLPGDFDGDGLTDLAAAWNDSNLTSVAVFRSTGTRFSSPVQWLVRQGGWSDNAKWTVGYFNNDNRADLAAVWNDAGFNSIAVRLSTGSSFTIQQWATRQGGWIPTSQFLAGDFTGDGLSDIAVAWHDVPGTSIGVYGSTGSSFTNPTQWAVRDGGWADDVRWTAADFDGDGIDDLAAIWNWGGMNVLTVRRSRIGSFATSHWSTNAGGWGSETAWCSGPFDTN
jgi:vibriolysin